ncbi:MAG: adenosine kinase [Acidimicrobiia bacterium]|nr:MAG: adenosine kinase [Acidimicrobiia bacterium]
MPRIDVLGIGNALVDVLSHETDEFVQRMGLNRGAMTLVDEERAHELYSAMGPGVEISGGSAANTIVGLASFGAKAAYLGKVKDDQLGEVFAHDIRSTGVLFDCRMANDGASTGRCLIVVTPDAQRTMNTYLGASAFLGPEDVDPDLVAAARVVYLEGYLWDRPEAKEAYRKAARIAHEAGNEVSLTLSDSFCVERHRPEWLKLVEEEVDLLFANEAEIQALYETDFDSALQQVRRHCRVAALTRSAHGSVIVAGDEVHVVPAHPVEHLVDTTGAGDLYASGFLFGYTRGADLATCARLGSLAASEVISHLGARPETSLAELAKALLPA